MKCCVLLVVLFGGEIGGETEVGRYPPPLTLLEEEELLIAILDRWLAMGASWCLRRRCLFRICYCGGGGGVVSVGCCLLCLVVF